jgi:hypothetical protein
LPQLPEWPPEWPDIAWPVEPKPPRDVEEDDEDDDELVPLPLWSALLLEVKPTEVEFGGRPEDVVCRSRELDEPYQCQPREFDELDERLHGCCWTADCLPKSMMSRTGAGGGA